LRSLPPHPRLVRCIGPHLSPSLPPSPTQSLRGHSLFVPESSRAILKPSSDYARRDKDGTALWRCPINPASLSRGDAVSVTIRTEGSGPLPHRPYSPPLELMLSVFSATA